MLSSLLKSYQVLRRTANSFIFSCFIEEIIDPPNQGEAVFFIFILLKW
jgi:hypothetical protein